MTMQLGLPFSVCCLIRLEFPFSRLIPLLGSHLYVCTHAFIYSYLLNPTWFLSCPHQGQSRQQKYSGLSCFCISDVFSFIPFIMCFIPFLPAKQPVCTSLCSFTATFYPHPCSASTHKCMPAPCREVFYTRYSDSNHIPLTVSQALTLHHATDRAVISLIMLPLPLILLQSSWNQEQTEHCQVSPWYSNSSLLLQKIKIILRNHLHAHFFFPPKQNYFEFWPRTERKRYFLLNLSSLC